MLYYTILYYAILYYTISDYTIFHHTVPYYTILFCKDPCVCVVFGSTSWAGCVFRSPTGHLNTRILPTMVSAIPQVWGIRTRV